MIQLGQYATLEVIKTTDFGVYLEAGPFGEVLLPLRYVPKDVEVGQEVKVFSTTSARPNYFTTARANRKNNISLMPFRLNWERLKALK